MSKVVIDSLPRSGARYRDKCAIIVVDVIRFTTTAATAVSLGRDVYPVSTTDDALELSVTLNDPILAGEQGGNVPFGFQMTNSPVLVTALSVVPCGSYTDPGRPIVLVSSSGTRLFANSLGKSNVYLGCFRNMTALAEYVCQNESHVAVLGAGTRGNFRREDQMGCAWITEKLVAHGFDFEDSETESLVEEWSGRDIQEIREGRSANYLISTGQSHDLEFVLHHIEDLNIVPIATPAGKIEDAAGKAATTHN